jgi:plasmid maintenance system antidote protein VapI
VSGDGKPQKWPCAWLAFSANPEFWLNAQRAVDLWDAAKAAKDKIDRITPLNAA